jgi:hypothetical protein
MATLPNLQAISNALKELSTKVPNLSNLPVLTVLESLENTAKRNDQILKTGRTYFKK